MPISDSHKFIFVHIPRTAGSAIWSALQAAGCELDFLGNKHMRGAEIRKKIGEKRWQQYLKFTFVRNPYDRLHSRFVHRIDAKRSRGMEPSTNYSKWVRRCAKNPQSIRGVSMVSYVTDDRWHIQRYEALHDGFQVMCDMIGVSATIGNVRVNASERPKWRSVYQPSMLKHANTICKADCERFGYDQL